MTELFIHINKVIELLKIIVVIETFIIMTADLTINIALNLSIQIDKFNKFSESGDFINLFTLKKLLAMGALKASKTSKVNIATETTMLITVSLIFNNTTNLPI